MFGVWRRSSKLPPVENFVVRPVWRRFPCTLLCVGLLPRGCRPVPRDGVGCYRGMCPVMTGVGQNMRSGMLCGPEYAALDGVWATRLALVLRRPGYVTRVL